jgi:hypothetical protein
MYPAFGIRRIPGNLSFKNLNLAFPAATAPTAGRGQYNAPPAASQQNSFTRSGVADNGTILQGYFH